VHIRFSEAERKKETHSIPWETGSPQPALVEFVDDETPQGRVLDIGCGVGTHALSLAQRGYTVVGVDFTPTPIRRIESTEFETQDGNVPGISAIIDRTGREINAAE
jgi:2-polyprenyl-3-methyl-5-hydroxy-6-metoxy-1,4-benzoquinol methylase